MRRNLISILCLDDENIHYHFGDGMCVIQYNNENVGLAIRQDELYLLSHCESVNDMSTSSAMNVCDVSISESEVIMNRRRNYGIIV